MCSSWLLYLCRKCLSTPLSASVKLLWKCLKILPWHIWVTALWMSWITYACHITGLCCLLLVIGYRFSSIACVALTWPIVWHGCWEADTVFQLATLAGFFPGNGLHPAHDVYFCLFSISLTFIINVSHMSKDWGLFCLSTGWKGSLLQHFLFLVICFPLKLWRPFLSVLMQWNSVWPAANATFCRKSLGNFKGLLSLWTLAEEGNA